MNHLSDFKPGDQVVLSRIHDGFLRGQTGTVHKVLKGHNTVRVLLANGDTYDAHPYNIDKVEKDA